MRAERSHRRELFLAELRSPKSLALSIGALVILGWFGLQRIPIWPWLILGLAVAAGWIGMRAHQSLDERQFMSRHYRGLWKSVRDRLARFDSAYSALKNAWDEELPVLRERVQYTADVVYEALRRADVMQAEVSKSEGHMASTDTSNLRPSSTPTDKKAQELYQLADRNVAEYRQRLAAVTAGIHRCEAQTTVFITTLDSLRVRLLGYRLMGKSPEAEHQAFLETIGDAKSQLDAVDKALEEISFDRLVAQIELEGVPPPVPENAQTEEHL
ncbi:MAG: hypothetical protein JNK63_10840 [Chthonomonas sp.]|nr:hypothetical protein [Chthonomonas sp.]